MDGSQVGILEQRDEVSLSGLLKGHDGGGLEAQIRLGSRGLNHGAWGNNTDRETNLEILSNLTNKTLERQLADQELGRLLVTPRGDLWVSHWPESRRRRKFLPNLTKSDGTGAEPVGLLDTTSGVLSVGDTRQQESQEIVVQNPRSWDGEGILTTAVFLAALVASCLRGAFPRRREKA